MDFGTVIAIAAINVGMLGLLKVDQHRAEDRADKKIEAFKVEIQSEMREFRAEMRAFHQQHSEMNKRILDLEMERKHGCKTV